MNFDTLKESRRGMVVSGPNGPTTGTTWLDVYGWELNGGGNDTNRRALQVGYSYGSSGSDNGKVSMRMWSGAAWKNWVPFWTGANTTVDSNGFIKKASPIARLAGAPEKMADDYLDGFTLAGSVAVNSEAEGVSGERVSVGVYKGTGSLGFAEEGWNTEVPQDVNGNRLCFVETSTGKDGTIYVKVSKRRFDIDTAAIVAGDPMDIPDGRWIDLRLEMPMGELTEEPVPDEQPFEAAEP